jgi:hypothetical protein
MSKGATPGRTREAGQADCTCSSEVKPIGFDGNVGLSNRYHYMCLLVGSISPLTVKVIIGKLLANRDGQDSGIFVFKLTLKINCLDN